MHREGHVGAALLAYAPLGFLAVLLAGLQLALLGAVGIAGLASGFMEDHGDHERCPHCGELIDHD